MKYARIDSDTNKCAEFISFEPEGKFHPDVVWALVPENLENWVNEDYIKSGDTVAPPSIDYLKDQLLNVLAWKRWEKEEQGITVDSKSIDTTRESQKMIGNSYNTLKNNLVASVDWKFADGTWGTVTLTELEPIATAVAEHVKKCFNAEKIVSDKINALSSIDDLAVFNIIAELDTALAA